MKSNVRTKTWKRLSAFFVAVMMMVMTMIVPASAEDAPQEVKNATDGVLVVELGYQKNSTDEFLAVSSGTCFLINDEYVLTCYHNTHITDADVFADGTLVSDYMAATFGDDWEKYMKCRVYFQSGNSYAATEDTRVANAQYDYTALKLESTINATALTLGESSTVESGSGIWALGFRGDSQVIESGKSDQLTGKDVSLLDGHATKITKVDITDGYEADCISHDAGISQGCSGGPLLNTSGQVIGINFAKTVGSETNNYALNIDMVRNALDKTGITYNTEPTPVDPSTGGSGEEPAEITADTTELAALIDEANTKNAEDYTEDSYNAMTSAKDDAQSVLDNVAATYATQEEADAAQKDIDSAVESLQTAIDGLEEGSKLPVSMPILIGAGVAVVVVIIIIIVVVVAKGKKKVEPEYDTSYVPGGSSNSTPNNGGFSNAAPEAAPTYTPPTSGAGGGTSVLGDAGATGVLNDIPATGILRKNYATLSGANGVTVNVNQPNFKIGRDPKKVTYCVNNHMVSSQHAEIRQKGSSVVIVDLHSTNGTQVNGYVCNPNEEVALKDGDKIKLADEEFTIHLL